MPVTPTHSLSRAFTRSIRTLGSKAGIQKQNSIAMLTPRRGNTISTIKNFFTLNNDSFSAVGSTPRPYARPTSHRIYNFASPSSDSIASTNSVLMKDIKNRLETMGTPSLGSSRSSVQMKFPQYFDAIKEDAYKSVNSSFVSLEPFNIPLPSISKRSSVSSKYSTASSLKDSDSIASKSSTINWQLPVFDFESAIKPRPKLDWNLPTHTSDPYLFSDFKKTYQLKNSEALKADRKHSQYRQFLAPLQQAQDERIKVETNQLALDKAKLLTHIETLHTKLNRLYDKTKPPVLNWKEENTLLVSELQQSGKRLSDLQGSLNALTPLVRPVSERVRPLYASHLTQEPESMSLSRKSSRQTLSSRTLSSRSSLLGNSAQGSLSTLPSSVASETASMTSSRSTGAAISDNEVTSATLRRKPNVLHRREAVYNNRPLASQAPVPQGSGTTPERTGFSLRFKKAITTGPKQATSNEAGSKASSKLISRFSQKLKGMAQASRDISLTTTTRPASLRSEASYDSIDRWGW